MAYVVTLTGGKNNAGDFLIKDKAHALLKAVRPDLEVVDLDGWLVSEKDLDVINGSVALLLTGGPALIPNMIPAVYSIDSLLDNIKVPIATYGIGWFHSNGDWSDTNSMLFNSSTKKLFNKLSNNGMINSVRDYYTCELLLANGVKNVLMTGCPVLYNGGDIAKSYDFKKDKEIQVAISIGVGFKDMKKLLKQTESLLLGSKEGFIKITAIFHHSLESNKFVAKSLTKKQTELVNFLNEHNIQYIDISGSAKKLMETYDQFDLHLGYRVHAHLYMLSQGKPSYLIAEDGRGTGQQQVLGESNFRSYVYSLNSKILRGFHRLGISIPTKIVDGQFSSKLLNYIDNDMKYGLPKHKNTIAHIETHFHSMQVFLSKLP